MAVLISLMSTAPATAAMRLRSLVSLRRRSLRMRLRCRAGRFHVRLRLRLRTVLHPRLLGLRHLAVFHAWLPLILNAWLRLWLTPILESRLCRVRLRLHRSILDARSLCPRLRLRLCMILKPRVRLRLRMVFKPRVCCVGLRLYGSVLPARFIGVGLAMRCVWRALVHVGRIRLCRAALRRRTINFSSTRSWRDTTCVCETMLCERL